MQTNTKRCPNAFVLAVSISILLQNSFAIAPAQASKGSSTHHRSSAARHSRSHSRHTSNNDKKDLAFFKHKPKGSDDEFDLGDKSPDSSSPSSNSSPAADSGGERLNPQSDETFNPNAATSSEAKSDAPAIRTETPTTDSTADKKSDTSEPATSVPAAPVPTTPAPTIPEKTSSDAAPIPAPAPAAPVVPPTPPASPSSSILVPPPEQESSAAATPTTSSSVSTSKPAPSTHKAPFSADPALISVLRDLSKSIKGSDEISRLNDPAQKTAIVLALEALDQAIATSLPTSNRIIAEEDKEHTATMSTESWESGDILLPGNRHASLNVLWAKKANGLINVCIAGNGKCQACPGAEGVAGHFAVVINGRSVLDSGFDIQSQGNVNYWMGKLNGFSVDANNCPDNIVDSIDSASPALQSLLTERKINHLQQTLANRNAFPISPLKNNLPAPAQGDGASKIVSARVLPQTISNMHATALRKPSVSALVLAPDNALAGQYVTVVVVNHDQGPEAYVELSFNGVPIPTTAQGKAIYLVPEDAHPGKSLLIAMPGRPDATPLAVNVLQPLVTPQAPQAPSIDRISAPFTRNGMLVVEGHNFDGISDNNKVMIDDNREAQVLVSSPVQLKVSMPTNLTPGQHSIYINANGLRSNTGHWDTVSVNARPNPTNRQRVAARMSGSGKRGKRHMTRRHASATQIASKRPVKPL